VGQVLSDSLVVVELVLISLVNFVTLRQMSSSLELQAKMLMVYSGRCYLVEGQRTRLVRVSCAGAAFLECVRKVVWTKFRAAMLASQMQVYGDGPISPHRTHSEYALKGKGEGM
jgi:hypothetical protein